jgi:TRAP-type C4-dicarboxylate transport system substrate-binding protein
MRITAMRSTIAAVGLLVLVPTAHGAQYNANTYMPDNHPLGKLGYIDFAEDVKNRTNGKITFKVFTGGVLVPPRSSLSAIGENIAQVGFFAGTYTPKELPVANLIGSLAFVNTDPYVQVFAVTEFSLKNQAQLAEWKRNKIVFGGGYATPPYNLFCTAEIRTLNDMKGKKLRMPGGVYERWARHVGALSVNISSNEMYSGLEKGALDCAANANDALRTHSLWEVAKFANITESGVYYSGAMYGYNPLFWSKLSPEDRKVLFSAMATNIIRTTIGYKKIHDETLEWAKGKGVKVVEPAADLKAKTAEFIEQDRKKLAEQAKADGIADAEAIINDYLAYVAKWDRNLKSVSRNDEKTLVALFEKDVYGTVDPASYGLK